jgi:glycine C-acetyltransferase
MREAGFDVLPGLEHAIGDLGRLAGAVVTGEHDRADRVRAGQDVQLSASHSERDVRDCVQAFIDARDAVA